MKSKAKSYADEAQAIIKRFKPRVDQGDQMATEAMNKQLADLRDQQEQERNAIQEKIIKKAYGGFVPTQTMRSMDMAGGIGENEYGYADEGLPEYAEGGDMPDNAGDGDKFFNPKTGIIDWNVFFRQNPRKIDTTSNKVMTKPLKGNGITTNLWNQPASYSPETEPLVIAPSKTTVVSNNISNPTNRRISKRSSRESLGPQEPLTPTQSKQFAGFNPSGSPISDPYEKSMTSEQIASNAGVNNGSGIGDGEGFNANQWGTLGANLAGSIGSMIPMFAAQGIKMPTSKNVTTPDYVPERFDEERKAIERGYDNIVHDPSLSGAAKTAVTNKAYIDEANSLGKLGEQEYNTNVRGKAEHDKLRVDTDLANERNRIGTETMGAQKKLSDLSALSGAIGGMGTTVSNTFSDRQKEDSQLVALSAMAPSGKSFQQYGGKYFEVTRDGELSITTPMNGDGTPIYMKGGKKITGEEYTKYLREQNSKNNVGNIAKSEQKAGGGYIYNHFAKPRYRVTDGRIEKY